MEPVQQKLSRLCAWCVEGNVAGAELELHEWCRHDDAPPAARVLLGSLLARRGQTEHALAVLHKRDVGHQSIDLAQSQLLVSVLVDAELPGTARQVVTQMFHSAEHDLAAGEWVRAMDAPGAAERPAIPDGVVEQLSLELAGRQDIIPTLVVAQKAQPETQNIAILRSAVGRVAIQTEDPQQLLTLCQAMADLSLLAHDADEARRWAHRGLKINPYAAGLALVLASLADDQVLGPPALDVLAQAAEAHPQYPDLQAALIRRQESEGQHEAARLRLRAWLERQPDHPLARQLEKEIAA